MLEQLAPALLSSPITLAFIIISTPPILALELKYMRKIVNHEFGKPSLGDVDHE